MEAEVYPPCFVVPQAPPEACGQQWLVLRKMCGECQGSTTRNSRLGNAHVEWNIGIFMLHWPSPVGGFLGAQSVVPRC